MFRCFIAFLGCLAVTCLSLTCSASAEESITVTVVGTLKTGIVAIGGETTGVTITAREITWELNFGKNEELRKAADKWNGQQVTVTGSLERRAGVEVKQRWIVSVSSLKGPEERQDELKKDNPKPESKPALPRVSGDTRPGTTVVAVVEKDRTVIDIHCDRGIDRCVILREANEWPKHVVARLRLKGLESFKATNGDITLDWSVSSTGQPASTSSLRIGNKETRLTAESPYFSEGKVVTVGSEQPKIPLKSGYFEVPLPAKFFEGNPTQITLQWVDFYR